MVPIKRPGTTKQVLGMGTAEGHLFITSAVCIKERKILLHCRCGKIMEEIPPATLRSHSFSPVKEYLI